MQNLYDNLSGIAGFYYWEIIGEEADIPEEEKIYISGPSGTVTVEKEGETTIAFQAKDNAGNLSALSTITIRKDSSAPNDFIPRITDKTGTSFTINAETQDSISGIEGYYFYVEGKLQNSRVNTTGKYEVKNLDTNKSYAVYVEAVDKAGNIKKSMTITVSIKGELLTPRIILSGKQGDNGYYIGNVTVTIQDSANEEETMTDQIAYQVTGTTTIARTVVEGRTATLEITLDGTSDITAQALSSGGGASDTIMQRVNKDSTPPKATLAVEKTGETSVTMTATGEDSMSGVANYEFHRSTISSTAGFVAIATENSTSNSATYVYDGLSLGTRYYLKAVVRDNAGNVAESDVVEITIMKDPLTLAELETKIGEYVDYKPVSGTFGDHTNSSYNGYNSGEVVYPETPIQNSSLQTDENLKWRILFVEDGILTLIADDVTGEIGLGGQRGYNNAVLLLNNACKNMYSNSSLGATGRSLCREDIEHVSNYDKYSYENYGEQIVVKKWDNVDNMNYPLMLYYEKTAIVNGRTGTQYNQNEQNSYITGEYSYASSLAIIYTHYSYTLNESNFADSNPIYLNLFRYEIDGKTNLTKYWLATRCLAGNSDRLVCNIGNIEEGRLNTKNLASSLRSERISTACSLRPVVEIPLDRVNIGGLGYGERERPYSIEAK